LVCPMPSTATSRIIFSLLLSSLDYKKKTYHNLSNAKF
jgi:hypothetical protein